jgi:hypothetical protein
MRPPQWRIQGRGAHATMETIAAKPARQSKQIRIMYAMAEKPPILPYQSPPHRVRHATQTPVRNQLVELVRSAWVVIESVGRFVGEWAWWR